MIRRLGYLALGAWLALWTVRKLQSLRPDHVVRRAADRAVTLADQLRDFAGDVRRLAASRESELRAEFGLDTVNVDRVSRTDANTINEFDASTDDVKGGR